MSSTAHVGLPDSRYPGGKRSEAAALVELTGAQRPRRVGRNVAALAAGQLVTWTMTLLWTLIVPRKLGPTGLGTVMSAWSVTGIMALILGFGTKNYLVRTSVADPESAPMRIGTTFVFRIVLSPLLFAAAFAYGQAVGWDHDAKLVLYLAAAATVCVAVAEPLQAGFQATERMEYLAYSEVISKSGQGLVGILVVLMGFGAIGVTASWTLMAATVILLDLYWLRGHFTVDPRTSVRRLVAIVRESSAYWLYALFFVIYLWIDFVMLSLLAEPDVVGWYAVPTRLFQTLMALPTVVGTAWLPGFVRGFEEGGGQLRRTARKPIEFVLMLSLPIAAMTAIAAGPVIDVIYGSDYAKSVPVLAVLALSIPPMYMNIMFSQVLVAMERQATWTKVMAATIFVNPLLNLALIPATQDQFGNGAIGAAISMFLTESVVVAAGIVVIGRLVFDGRTAQRAMLAVLSAAAMWGVAFAVGRLAGGAASLGAGLLTLVVAARVLHLFSAEEIALVKRSVRKVAHRLRAHRPRAALGPQ